MFADALPMHAPQLALTDTTTTRRQSPKTPMDEAKFEAFYKQTAGSVWSYLYRMTGDASTADDLLQKTYFRFIRSNPDTTGDDHMRSYVFRTATNLAFDHFRDQKRRRERELLSRRDEVRPDRGELRHDMMRIFGELKPQERALLWLAHVEESSHDEISEALGVKSKSVRVLLFRARKRLAELLTRKGIGPAVAR